MRPGIREDGAGRGLLRGAPTRPLARPHAEMPLKLPEAWRAEPLQSLALLSAQPRAAQRTAPRCSAHHLTGPTHRVTPYQRRTEHIGDFRQLAAVRQRQRELRRLLCHGDDRIAHGGKARAHVT